MIIKTPPLTNELNYEICAKNIGNRFDMVVIASIRAREIQQGYSKKIKNNNGSIVSALQEIQEGYVTKDYLKKVK
jgi:DNA-directed RNA polymerase subunit omega